jgi:hypothetical protein
MSQAEPTEEQLERIRDFVAALRSGEYEQTDSQLARQVDEDKWAYCCEGVAAIRYGQQLGCEVEYTEEGQLALDGQCEYAHNGFWRSMGLVGRVGSPSTSVFTFVLPDEKMSPMEQSEFSYMSLNDDGFTFTQIADLIEWQFLSCPRG